MFCQLLRLLPPQQARAAEAGKGVGGVGHVGHLGNYNAMAANLSPSSSPPQLFLSLLFLLCLVWLRLSEHPLSEGLRGSSHGSHCLYRIKNESFHT